MSYINKEKKKEYQKSWLKRNPHKIKEYNEKYKDKRKVWREKNKEKIKIRIEEWRQKNLEHDLALKKAYYQRNRERHLFLSKQRLQDRKRICFIKYSKNPPECACCGVKGLIFLSIDHMNGDGAKHRKEIGGGDKIYRWLIKNNFPTGFQVLCYNCNVAKGVLSQCPHKEK